MRLIVNEQGVATIEYVLVIVAAVALSAMILGMTGITSQIVALVCPAVDTASTAGSCVG